MSEHSKRANDILEMVSDYGRYCADGLTESAGREFTAIKTALAADSAAPTHAPSVTDELVASLLDVLEWLDDGNRVLSDSCRASVDRAEAAIARATQ